MMTIKPANDFGEVLKTALRQTMTGMEWQVDIEDQGSTLLITAHTGTPRPVEEDLRSTVIWQFSFDGLTAQITLPNPPDYQKLVAHFMAGNLFGQALGRSWRRR